MKTAERFLKYVSFDTQSKEESDTFPSTLKQLELGKYLAEELSGIGLIDAELDEKGYVYATLPASAGSEGKPKVAYIAHMDVSPAAPSANIVTHIEERDGKHVIATDGTTLLGADDKAGIAEIVTAFEMMLSDPSLKHPEMRIVVTPDEEVGMGVEYINLDKVNADYAYTADGGRVGELTYECFNAVSARVTFNGYSIHPGSAYGVMKNAVLMAADYIRELPADMTPATTRGREGFIHADSITGEIADARIDMIIRDFDSDGLAEKQQIAAAAADRINEKYGPGSCEIEFRETYRNMKEKIVPEYAFLLDNVRETYSEMGIEVSEEPIRGGTDGARLSYMGLPTPNLGTGGADFHGTGEHIAVEDMDLAAHVLIRLAAKFA